MRPKTLATIAAAALLSACKAGGPAPIKVGVLHSLSGTMAASEKPVVDSVLLALEEVNRSGGVLGRRLEPVVADGRSDPAVFRTEAERLLAQEHVAVLFGCWTSASRKAVKPVVESRDSLLFYPVQYEGMERSEHIVYLGAAPNQQTIPAVTWAFAHLGRRFFLVGSDYVFPRAANAVAKDVLRSLGGEVVGERYVPLAGRDFAGIAAQIQRARPDVILNTVNGDSNIALFQALHAAGPPAAGVAVFSLSLDENGADAVQRALQAGHPGGTAPSLKARLGGVYACWSYFQSIDNPWNADFIGKFRRRYGEAYRVTDPMEAAYLGVHLWSQAVAESGSFNRPSELLTRLAQMSMPAAEGVVTIDTNNHHARRTVRIGRLNEDGGFDIVWASRFPVDPAPYPRFRAISYWDAYLAGLQRGWGGAWAAAGAGR